mmetsp:Transcript_4578/g.8623  ORF Transcript_4578/g.8623 Transcript_4578/m.8623 type:complete len:466 (-) Transcript_4578:221-1618(-)
MSDLDAKRRRVKLDDGDVHEGVVVGASDGDGDVAAANDAGQPLAVDTVGSLSEEPALPKPETESLAVGADSGMRSVPKEELAKPQIVKESVVNGVLVKRIEWIRRQEDDEDNVSFQAITNSGHVQDSIWLVCLKNIFAKQLPNMPKEYIVRLLMERNHESVIAIKGNTVVGGVTFRTFRRQGFAEIAFCAVTSEEQVKGYGTRLMNYVKEYSRERHKTTHFLTYADNNAVGYFVKQGFSKEILLERERWYGYIKDYDGGTMMECPLSDAISYTDFPKTIRMQREALDAKLRQFSNSHIVYPGLKFDKPVRRMDPMSIPGVAEAGWTPTPPAFRILRPDGTLLEPTLVVLHNFMREVHTSMMDHPDAWPFLDAVDGREVPDYYDIIKDPVDIALIKRRLAIGEYYITLEMFAADFRRMFENCRIYNAPDTVYFKCATKLEQHFEQKIQNGIQMKRRNNMGASRESF